MFYTRNTLSHKMRNTLKLKIYIFILLSKKKKSPKKKIVQRQAQVPNRLQTNPQATDSHQKKKNRAVQRLKKKKKTNPQVLTKGFIKINEITKLTLT